MNMWSGAFEKKTDDFVKYFSESVSVDKRLAEYDIQGSIAHAEMLGETGIIPETEAQQIVTELRNISREVLSGDFNFRPELEDVHMNIESVLTERLGDVGAKLHSGRSRNDQIATDERLFIKDAVQLVTEKLTTLQKTFLSLAEDNMDVIMPAFTHLQYAQPVLAAHYFLAFAEMFERDKNRLNDCRRRADVLPLGSGALAGSTLPLDRETVAQKLGFADISHNSMDAVSDRDYFLEFLSALSIIAVHCSRLSEDVIIMASSPFRFLHLDDAFCTGSSLMPQKKNPDVAELTRGKTGGIFGNLFSLLTTMKGLPMTYNRDMQEDKEGVFDSLDTTLAILTALCGMMSTCRFDRQRLSDVAEDPLLMATDLAEWLVKQNVPFRQAHRQVGEFVRYCRENNKELTDAGLSEIQQFIPEATDECLGLFSAERSVKARNLIGGTAPARVQEELKKWKEKL